jgi:beta-phosphoglucomutase
MIKAIIFDMDGVLIDAKEWHYEALNKALRLFGYEISRYDHLTTFDGLPTSRKLDMLSVQQGLPRALHGFINEMKQAYTMDYVNTHCRPTFSHEYALAKLKSSGYLLAVASNSIRSTVEIMMNKSNLAPFLDLKLSASDVNLPKPNPEIYNTAIKKLGLHPNECLVVEDNENGIKAAIASGSHVLAVEDVHEVTYSNIIEKIKSIDEAH